MTTFLLFDGAGALLWAGAGVVGGATFHRAIDRVLDLLASLGSWALVILGVGARGLHPLKWWQRRRFYKMLRMARISPSSCAA